MDNSSLSSGDSCRHAEDLTPAQPRNRAERRHPERRSPLNIPGAAEYLGTSARHVRRLIAERRVASYRLGGRVLLSPDDLDELLARSRREAIR
jgi:excisionase family DNA binding protein